MTRPLFVFGNPKESATMKTLLFGMGLAAALAFNAHAQVCFSPSAAEALAKDKGWEIVEFKNLLADAAGSKALEANLKNILAGAVDADPADVPDFDTIIVVEADNVPTAYGLIFKDGCALQQGSLPKEVFKSLKMISEGS